MSISVTRRGVTIGAAAIIALLVTLAVASQATAATYYACVKKNGSARVFTKKPKCKKGESKLSWNSPGPAGKNGVNGVNGVNGKNGTNGTNGTKGETGAPGGFFGVLPSGKSMSGTYAAEGNVTGQQYRTAVSFLLSLPTAPGEKQIHFIEVGEAVPSGCSGNVAAPAAVAGNLCIFEGVSINNEANRGELNPINDEAPNLSMPVFGFGVYSSCKTAPCIDEGTWAVTAP
jgi:hypothetical protein